MSYRGAPRTRGWSIAVCVAAFLLSLAPEAYAQRASTRVTDFSLGGLSTSDQASDNGRDWLLGIERCREVVEDGVDLSPSWRLNTASVPSGGSYTIKAASADAACDTARLDEASGSTCDVLRGQTSATGGSIGIAIPPRRLFGFDDPSKCSDADPRVRHDVSLVFEAVDTNLSNIVDYDTVRITLDASRRAAPTELETVAGENAITVSWKEIDVDAEEGIVYRVYVTEDPADFVNLPEDAPIGHKVQVAGSSARITGLRVDRSYWVAVTSWDPDTTNESEFAVADEPVITAPVTDFFELYREAGGRETGGHCAMSPGPGSAGGALWLLGLAALVARRRRVSASVAASALGAMLVVGVASPADAAPPRDRDLTPISGFLELRAGPALPNIDDEFDGTGPYERMFGNDSGPLFELEYDWQFWRGVGSLALGSSIGYMGAEARALTADGTRAADRTDIDLMPVRMGLVYRFDWLQRRFGVPFSFAAKLGVDYVFWWVGAGDRLAKVQDADGGEVRGSGGTMGWHGALGVHFLLDALAPGMARSFDMNVGVNNSYVFAEWMHADIDDFGSDESWDLGTDAFMFGLGFEF